MKPVVKPSTYAIVRGKNGELLYIADSVLKNENFKELVGSEMGILAENLTKDEAVAFIKLTGVNK